MNRIPGYFKAVLIMLNKEIRTKPHSTVQYQYSTHALRLSAKHSVQAKAIQRGKKKYSMENVSGAAAADGSGVRSFYQ